MAAKLGFGPAQGSAGYKGSCGSFLAVGSYLCAVQPQRRTMQAGRRRMGLVDTLTHDGSWRS